jgi:hypothetical protein
MYPREYLFHRDGGVTWSLVFDAKSGLWHIEKNDEQAERIRMSLEEFERSPHGQELSRDYEKALTRAQDDA